MSGFSEHDTEAETVKMRAIAIPLWFLKLIGITASTLTGFFIIWMVWVSSNIIEIRSSIDKSVQNQAEIKQLRQNVSSLTVELAKIQVQMDKIKRGE